MSKANYTPMTANGTFTPAGAKVLVRLVINTKGTTANTIQLLDGAVVIATIDTTVAPGYWDYGLRCSGGLSAVMATGTAANATLVWE